MYRLITIASILLSLQLSGQTPAVNNTSFKPGEKLRFVASYYMSSLWTDIAGIDMDVTDVPGKSKPIDRIIFTANTLTSWDNYVKVRHSYQTWIEASSVKPMIMKQDSDVKGHTKQATYTFKHKSGYADINVTSNDAPPIKKQIKFSKDTYDIVSLLYYIRNLDFANYKIGKTVPVSFLFLENMLTVNVKYLGKETIKVDNYGPKSCYKVALILNHDFVVKKDASTLYLTADQNKVPILITTVYKEGKAMVKLTKMEGLAH